MAALVNFLKDRPAIHEGVKILELKLSHLDRELDEFNNFIEGCKALMLETKLLFGCSYCLTFRQLPFTTPRFRLSEDYGLR